MSILEKAGDKLNEAKHSIEQEAGKAKSAFDDATESVKEKAHETKNNFE